MSAHLDAYLAFLAVEKGLAPNSLDGYARDLGKYEEHLERHGRDALGAEPVSYTHLTLPTSDLV